MKSNEVLIEYLVQEGVLKTPRVVEAFRSVDRGKFVLKEYADEAYNDGPLFIGFGATISQPTTVAFMLELLQVQEGETVLDVGSGSAWTTALLAQLVGAKGKVTGTEFVPELVALGQENLKQFQFTNLEILQAGQEAGLPGSVFDKILVSASAEHLPDALVSQLKVGGRMVIPVLDSLYAVDKTERGFKQKEYYGFVFVPLR